MTGPDGSERWRCFVAVPVPHDLCAALSAFVESLRRHPGADGWRWTDAGAWHLTLAFLGSTDSARVPGLVSALTEVVAEEPPFSLRAGGLGAFPSRGSGRVLWYGIADPDGRLRRLASEVRAALRLEADDRFRGHVTLARARDRFGSPAGELLDSVVVPEATILVGELILFRSHLGHGPARYEELARAALSGVPVGAGQQR